MSVREVRAQFGARVQSLGYRRLDQNGHADAFEDPDSGHRATIVPFPRWGRRIDVLTVESSLPLPEGGRTIAFRLDVGSQVHPEGAAVPGRWNAAQVASLCESVILPYLDSGRTAGDILAMLVTGEIRPVGSAAATAVLQHGYFLAKWWQLTQQIQDLRDIAELLPAVDRVNLQHAPWGRTELAEVLWFGRDLPPAPQRLPWGPGDQGDPRAERWFRHASHSEQWREAASPESAVAQGHAQSPRAV
ncbi:hypothetical protein [Pseudactinotalea sp.]|uniref:hypothetical protein n=1 Tax=Pseudactinotalea sp. TaxID=1926260 RepID=UPI003B3A4BCF